MAGLVPEDEWAPFEDKTDRFGDKREKMSKIEARIAHIFEIAKPYRVLRRNPIGRKFNNPLGFSRI